MTQVDRTMGLVGNVAMKAPCQVATTANIPAMNGLLVIDGYQTVAGDRVLVKNQITQSLNGIWQAATGVWTRAQDFDGNLDIALGTIANVNGGVINANTSWRVSAPDPITIGTSTITFAPASYSDAGSVNFLQAGAGAVARTMQSKERDVINLNDFGAVGDGVTDDSVAVQAALTAGAGRTVSGSGRTYLITVTLNFPSNIVVEDVNFKANQAAANLSTTTNQKNIYFKRCRVTTSGNYSGISTFALCDQVSFEDCIFSLQVAGPALSSIALRSQGSTNITVKNCVFYDIDSMIYLDKSGATNSDYVRIDGCYFEHTFVGATNNPTGVYQFNCNHLVVDGCVFKNIRAGGGAPIAGYSVYEGDGTSTSVTVTNCTTIVTTVHPHTMVQSSNAANCSVTNNKFYGTAQGITGLANYLARVRSSVSEVLIQGNYSLQGAILVAGGATLALGTISAKVTGNHIAKLEQNTPGILIGVSGANFVNYADVKDNYIAQTYASSINISECGYAVVEGNTCLNWNTVNKAPVTTYAYTAGLYWQSTNINGVARRNRFENNANLVLGYPQYGISVDTGYKDLDVRDNSYPTKCTIQNELFN